MRLKSLDIKGFKSFADKTHITLDNAITGIVGPNGCGKSNIVDAIRWVIGEHKIKSLRSDTLDDLIFNGSKSRNASGMAEVSLTFENTKNLLPTDFTTVTISRKFYKNGDSEYRLNDVVCRLKDIHNLFLDTGVSNDSYAIIELGMVDDIIKDKEGSRRRMLEQAAGISIYKTRKKEAKAKLEGTQSDISRIEDLLFEISNNLRTLESQARKAERYFSIKNEYKEISIELAKASLQEYNDKYQNLQSQHQELEDQKLKIETEIAGDEAQIEENKIKLIAMEQGLHVAQKQHNELINRIRGLENEKKLAAQKLDHLKDRLSSITNFLNNASLQEQTINDYIQNARVQAEQIADSLEELQDRMNTVSDSLEQKKVDFEEARTALDVERNKYLALQREQFEAEKNKAVSDTTLANLMRARQQAHDDRQRHETQLQQAQTALQHQGHQKTLLEQEAASLEQKQQETESKIFAHQERIEKLREQLVEENRTLDARRNEHDLIQSLIQSWEGFPESIQFLSQSSHWQPPAPLVSDILQVPDTYRKALEQVLDAYLNYYVVEDVAHAHRAIALLREHNKGKANFFVLTQLDNKPPAQSPPQNCISAREVVKVEPKYEALADWLLADVFIQDGPHHDTWPQHHTHTIVHQDGTAIHRHHSIGGGSTGVFEGNKIGRTKNLEKLAREIEQGTSQTQHLKNQIAALHQEIDLLDVQLNSRELKNKQQEIQQMDNQILRLNHQIENLESQIQQDLDKIEDLHSQIDALQSNEGDKNGELQALNEKLTAFEARIKTLQQQYALAEQDFQMAQQQHNQYQLDLNRATANLENLQQQIQFRENQLAELNQQIKTNKTQLAETNDLISETTGKLSFGDDEILELLTKKEKDEKQLNLQDQEYYNFRQQVADHEKSISRQRREKENAETLLAEIREQLNAMKLQTAGLKERLGVEFKVDLDTILAEPRLNEMSVQELQEHCEKLKKRLDNMGEINPTAVEAYQETKLRHDFIVDQKKDLEEARETLLATIEEVEKTANTKFKETFDQVRANFVNVFKALFTEDDNADLKLTDENNLAESAIEIYAQPKGKRPSTLTQLSGGEKTLTSTAFLFAIYLIKPAPFCILDEVDAPLDDANVGKFTSMIRKFSDNSQFIIVTHNKQTMAAVDVIYGVTMQEAGVSKLVPVDFRSLN